MYSVEPNEWITYKLRHEDEHLLVVDKPPGVPTQPGLGHDKDTLLNGLFVKYGAKLQKLGRDRDFGLLHRLDRQASGLLVVGLTVKAYDGLREAFKERKLGKFYWVIVKGCPKEPQGVINKPIAESIPKNERAIKRAKITSRVGGPGGGKEAITAYRVLQAGADASLVECRPITGRLHQIRVHMEMIGCPVFGDDVYAPPKIRAASTRLALHSHRLVFDHPITGEKLDVRSKWPRDLRHTLEKFGLRKPEMEEAPAPGDEM